VSAVQSFESAWSVRAEDTLPVAEYTRRRLVLRRQGIVSIATSIGWHFLTLAQSVPTAGCILVGISLNARRDLVFLDFLRAHEELWAGKPVFLFQVDKPYVLPLPAPVLETPCLTLFEDHALVCRHEGDAAFRFVSASHG